MGKQNHLRSLLIALFFVVLLYTSGYSIPTLQPSIWFRSSDRGSISPVASVLHAAANDPEVSKNDPLISEPLKKIMPILPAAAPDNRMNATFVTLARNIDVWEVAKSIRRVEDRFNHNYNYDWVFLNDEDFNDEFKEVTSALISGKAKYGKIPEEHWSFPEFVDQERAAKVREDMKEKNVIYGDSVSYRHMCRYESGFFFRHPLMLNYDWYWRVEPGIELHCDIKYDTFRFMAEHKKKYSFVISLYEYIETIPTLWEVTKTFIKKFPEHIANGNSLKFVSDDDGENYNRCHFWSNFEIGDLNWLRSKPYIDYFETLDNAGGFFYERWGDAPVHSLAAALMLKKEEIHFFDEIAYFHNPFTHCPSNKQYRLANNCYCNPNDNFDWEDYSCTARFYKLNNMVPVKDLNQH